MSKKVKHFLMVLLAAVMAAVCICFAACTGAPGANGADGKDGQDLNIYDVFDATNEARVEAGLEKLTFLEFVEQYMGYVSDGAEQATLLQSVMNRSLLSAVSILSQFNFGSSIGQSKSVFAGSGAIIDLDKEAGDAYIVTNAHVVYTYNQSYQTTYYNAEKVYVYLYGFDAPYENFDINYDGSLNDLNGGINAEVVGVSTSYDLAVLKITGSEVLKKSAALEAEFVQNDEVYAGQAVYAVGSPSGEGLSITQGVISRESEYTIVDVTADGVQYRVMRTDAAVNGGNSGGGLFNADGQIVGIINSKIESESIDNIAYALPSSYARRVVQSMIDCYERSGAQKYVGKYVLNITSKVTDTYVYYDSENYVARIHDTVAVESIDPNSIAVGFLKSGDVIKSVSIGKRTSNKSADLDAKADDFTVPTDNDYKVAQHYFSQDITRDYMLADIMFAVRSGDTMELVVERNGATRYVYLYFSGYTTANGYNTYS